MKCYQALGLVLMLVAGCSWSPLRDNTSDPRSPFFVQGNRPPSIDSIRMITDCYQKDLGNFCAFEAYAWISDPDRNILYDSIMASMITLASETLALGRMTFNPDVSGFSIRVLESQMPTGTLTNYVGDSILVTVRDDSGAVALRKVEFHDLDMRWPTIVHPKGYDTPDILTAQYPQLGWDYWQSCQNDPHTFSITVVQEHLNTAWDTSGLAATPATCLTDTSAIIGDYLDPGGPDGGITYSWYLTVITRRGDRITAKPGNFYIVTHS